MYKPYLEVISLIERTHRHFLEVVKLELDRLGTHDINNVQGLLLFNIGDAEMTVGELVWRGCYRGSNVSYNPQKNSRKRLSLAGTLGARSPLNQCSGHREGGQNARSAAEHASAPCRDAGADYHHQ
jgi:hypothetical protein